LGQARSAPKPEIGPTIAQRIGMNPELQALLDILLRAVPVELVDEEAAIELVVHARWPQGRCCPACGQACTRNGIWLACGCDDEVTIFIGTPLGSLRAPSVLGILLALRAMAIDHRGIGARPLARLLDIPHVTLWRHIHRLRRLLPPVPSPRLLDIATSDVLVCGRKALRLATVRVGAVGFRALPDIPPRLGRTSRRLVAESLRTWLNGTFHGVTARYLPRYVHEAMCRAFRPAQHMLAFVLAQIAR
jgi:transposase-like protein